MANIYLVLSKMNIIETKLAGCLIIEPKVIFDDRGFFMESFNEKKFSDLTGNNIHFLQDNQSYSTRGVLRGLHYQTGRWSQAKLVRVLNGEVLDVAVDIRPDSPTYGEHVSVVISSENNKQLFIPKGFAHGFLVLSETATFFYKCDTSYEPSSEGGILYNDEKLQIDWQLPADVIVISEKDKQLPLLESSKRIW